MTAKGKTIAGDWLYLAPCLVLALVLALVTGCGGGSSGVPAGSGARGTGSIAVTAKLPPLPTTSAVDAADLPGATRSIVLYVYGLPSSDGTDSSPSSVDSGVGELLVPPVVLVREPGQDTVSGTITKVPAGDAILRAYAYATDSPPTTTSQRPVSSAEHPGGAIAEAEVPVTVVGGQTSRVQMTAERLPVRVEIGGPDTVARASTVEYTATAYDADGEVVLGVTYQWQSSDTAILDFVGPGGKAEAKTPGDVAIQVTGSYRGHTWTAQKDVQVTGLGIVQVDPDTLDLQRNEQARLSVQVKDDAGEPLPGVDVTFTTSNSQVATVTSKGLVTGRNLGNAVIGASATLGGKTVIGLCRVTVGGAPPPGTDITGLVVDALGNLLVGVRIETSNGNRLWSALTGNDGRYLLEDVPDGARVISFALLGYTTRHRALVVNPSQVEEDEVMATCVPPTAPPVIDADPPVVDQVVGDAVITGTIRNLDAPAAILITNGSETLFEVNPNGTFRAVAILQPGDNTLYIRAVNGMGSAMTPALRVEYTPVSGDVFFRVTLTWDEVSDRDLHVLDPNDEHCYFANRIITTGNLDHDNIDSPPGTPENFTCTTALPGRYVVWVEPYSGSAATCQVRVVASKGPGAPRSWQFGPKLVEHEAWFACDVVVEQNGTIRAQQHVDVPALPQGLLRARPPK